MEVSLPSFRKRFTYDPKKDLLGKGGFGEVYKAYDNEDQIFVALKIAHASADDKHNLINEIKRFKKLNHPNIVQHIEAYEVNTGSTDIHGKPILYHVGILEYADKGTLADLLKKGTPDYRLIEDLAKDIIEGLAYLHSNNIIHRDLKPTNILLFSEGEKLRAKITDFGIAKRADATAASTQLVGTVEYMAPEYFTTGNVNTASDVWSLGVMLLEALTGVHPFGKTSQGISNEQIIANILNKDLTTATQNLTEPLKKIVTDCLRREPILRSQSTEILKAAFSNEKANGFGEKTQVIGEKYRENIVKPNKPNKRKLLLLIFIGIGFVLVGITFGVLKIIISNSKTSKLREVEGVVLIGTASIKSNNFLKDSLKSKMESPLVEDGNVNQSLPREFNSPKKANDRKVYCWYGYQEKKLGFDSKTLMLVVHSTVNYASEIFELTIPKNIDDGEALNIIERHINKNCPIVEKDRGENFYYTIPAKFGPNISVSYSDAIKSRGEVLGENPVTFNICSKPQLQNQINNGQHFSQNDKNKFGMNFYCVAYWYKLVRNSETSEFERETYISAPIKIKCASPDNVNYLIELLEHHLKTNCNIPKGFQIGVSANISYQGALDYIHEQFPEGKEVQVCQMDFFQQVICNR